MKNEFRKCSKCGSAWDNETNKDKPFCFFCGEDFVKEKPEWTPAIGEKVWIKVFSNWSLGTYIGFDVAKLKHVVNDTGNHKGAYLTSPDILPYDASPNEQYKKDPIKEAAFDSSIDCKPFDDDIEPQKYYEYGFVKGAKSDAARDYWIEQFKKKIING